MEQLKHTLKVVTKIEWFLRTTSEWFLCANLTCNHGYNCTSVYWLCDICPKKFTSYRKLHYDGQGVGDISKWFEMHSASTEEQVLLKKKNLSPHIWDWANPRHCYRRTWPLLHTSVACFIGLQRGKDRLKEGYNSILCVIINNCRASSSTYIVSVI